MLKPVLSSEARRPLARPLKKLRRRLGPLRDLDVMLEHLQEQAKVSRHALACEWAIEQVRHERDQQRAKATDKAGSAQALAKLGTWWGVRDEVAEAADAVNCLLAESLHLQLDAFAEQAQRVIHTQMESNGVAVGVAVGTTIGAAAAADPHQLRIAAKALRYTVEMAAEQGHKLPRAVGKSFKRMQDALGLWHDYVVLAERLMQFSLDTDLPLYNAMLQQRVLELIRVALQQAGKELQKFCKLWSERGQELSSTIREAFPLTRPAALPPEAIAPKTDPDPPDSTGTSTAGASQEAAASAV
jgi:CHAD domain-containing protein